jgi:hypothetical protein
VRLEPPRPKREQKFRLLLVGHTCGSCFARKPIEVKQNDVALLMSHPTRWTTGCGLGRQAPLTAAVVCAANGGGNVRANLWHACCSPL